MAPRHYFSLIEIEGGWISSDNIPYLQQKLIPELLRISSRIISDAKEEFQTLAVSLLLEELALISELCSQAAQTSSAIPVVYEGYHLTYSQDSLVVSMMSSLIDMIAVHKKTDSLEDSDNHPVEVLTKTLRKLELTAQIPTLWEQHAAQFRYERGNTRYEDK